MKPLVICLAVLLLSCGETTNKSSIQNSVAETNTASSSQEVTSQESLDNVETPVYGGPADFTIKVKGGTAGTSDLIGFYAEQNIKLDTTTISSNGTIRYQNPDGYPQGMYYVKLAEKKYLQIILGEDQKFTMETTLDDPDGQMKIDGSDENKAFFEAIKFEKPRNPKLTEVGNRLKGLTKGTPEYDAVKAEQDALIQERKDFIASMNKKYPNTLFMAFKNAGQNPDLREDLPQDQQIFQYRQEFWDNVDFSDKRLLRTQVINNKLKRYFTELTPQSPDSIFASAVHLCDRLYKHPLYYMFATNWVVKQYEPSKCTLMDPEAVFVRMVGRYMTKEKAFWADSMNLYAIQQKAREMSKSLVGDPGPDVTSKDLQGNTHRLFDNDADYLVVYMFSPSCEKCIEQTPKLVQWHQEWKNKGADVYAIALDTDNTELQNYIDKNGMKFPVVWDSTNRSIYGRYYVDITPEIFVLNKERKIIGKNLKVFQIETVINRDKEA